MKSFTKNRLLQLLLLAVLFIALLCSCSEELETSDKEPEYTGSVGELSATYTHGKRKSNIDDSVYHLALAAIESVDDYFNGQATIEELVNRLTNNYKTINDSLLRQINQTDESALYGYGSSTLLRDSSMISDVELFRMYNNYLLYTHQEQIKTTEIEKYYDYDLHNETEYRSYLFNKRKTELDNVKQQLIENEKLLKSYPNNYELSQHTSSVEALERKYQLLEDGSYIEQYLNIRWVDVNVYYRVVDLYNAVLSKQSGTGVYADIRAAQKNLAEVIWN